MRVQAGGHLFCREPSGIAVLVDLAVSVLVAIVAVSGDAVARKLLRLVVAILYTC